MPTEDFVRNHGRRLPHIAHNVKDAPQVEIRILTF